MRVPIPRFLWLAALLAASRPWAGAEPTLTQLLDACQFLGPGDIPTDTFQRPANAVYVATAADGGKDTNNGRSLATPFLHLDKAIAYANANSTAPLTIYLRRGIHYFKGPPFDMYQRIARGNLYVTAYANELVTIRPYYWPGNPTESGNERVFEIFGPYQNLTFDKLNFEGWSVIFNPGAPYAGPPLRNLVIKNVTARNFTRRNGDPAYGRTFLETAYLPDDIYGPGKVIFDHPERAKYQIDGFILANVALDGVDLAINIGDENDANVKSLRVTRVHVVNPTRQAGDSANDAFAVVNCWKVLIDQCRIVNINDDGIDLKAYDTAVVNCYVEGAGRNAVKFWRNGELINSILYNVTDIDDGAIVIKDGPFRMINSTLVRHTVGYAGVMAYDAPSTYPLEIVNSVFGECKTFYVGTHDFRAKNNRFFGLLDDAALVEGAVNASTAAQLNALPNCSGNAVTGGQFVNPATGDFALNPKGGWINAGTRQGVLLPVFDFLGHPRVFGREIDIGPVEFSGTGTGDWERYE